jgi:hypothetical protein
LKLETIILLLFVAISGNAQNFLPIQYDTLPLKYEVITSFSGDYASTSLQNQLTSKILYGGHISEEIKSGSFAKHSEINRFGVLINGGVEFRNYQSNLFGKERFGWLLKGEYCNFIGALYSKDLFGLTFYGNQRYLGEAVSFTGTRAGSWTYQKLGFGIVDKKSKSSLNLNAYGINQYSNSVVREGYLYQNEEGDSLSLVYAGGSDFFSSGIMQGGFGVGIDLDVRFSVKMEEKEDIFFQVNVNNLGVGFLPDVKRYAADSSFNFEGFTFDQLFGDANLIDSSFSFLDTLNIQQKDMNMVKVLPVFIQAGKIVSNSSDKLVQSFYGFRLYPTLTTVPQVYGGINLKAHKNLNVGLNAAFGGYSNFRYGIYLSYQLKSFNVGLATENLVGAFSKKGMGESINCRIRWALN